MAGVSHDVVLTALKESPELLGELLRRVAGVSMDGPLVSVDSATRFTASLETHPDLVFERPSGVDSSAKAGESGAPPAPPTSSWTMVEIQNRRDPKKARSWHLATSVLLQKHGMGDLIVITGSRSVATWARQVAQHRGALGTVKGLTPVVLHLSRQLLEQLLDPAVPGLALFAVWAVRGRRGRAAKAVVEKALEISESLPPELQDAQIRAILAMLNERLLDCFRVNFMDVNQIKESKGVRALRLFLENRGREKGRVEGRAEGLRMALLKMLAARGLPPTESERQQIAATEDLDRLDACIERALSAVTVAEVLGTVAEPSRPSGAANGTKANGHKSARKRRP